MSVIVYRMSPCYPHTVDGCRVSSGLGIMVMIALICNIFALQKPHGRASPGADSDLSVTLNSGPTSSDTNPELLRRLNIDSASISDYRGSI